MAFNFFNQHLNKVAELRGGSRVFSKRGADFQKNFANFVDLFFRLTELIFRALPKHDLVSVLTKKL